jgi:hypothetical protein
VLSLRHRPGSTTVIGPVSAVGNGLDGIDKPKMRVSFNTVGLQSGSDPALLDANAAQGFSADQSWTSEHPCTEAITVDESPDTNPGRSFTAKGRPRGAAGVTQCVELLQQLRGARIALAHSMGGPTAELATTILEGPRTDGS